MTKNKILFYRYVGKCVFKNATNKLPCRYGIVQIEIKKKTLLSKRACSDVSVSFILRLVFPAHVDHAFFFFLFQTEKHRTVRSVLNGIRGSTYLSTLRPGIFRLGGELKCAHYSRILVTQYTCTLRGVR